MRFAVAVTAAALAQLVAYLTPGMPALVALLYLAFASCGAGFFAGRRSALAGALSVFAGGAVFGVWSDAPRWLRGDASATDLAGLTALLVGIVPYAIVGAVAGALGGVLRRRALAAR